MDEEARKKWAAFFDEKNTFIRHLGGSRFSAQLTFQQKYAGSALTGGEVMGYTAQFDAITKKYLMEKANIPQDIIADDVSTEVFFGGNNYAVVMLQVQGADYKFVSRLTKEEQAALSRSVSKVLTAKTEKAKRAVVER